MDEQSCRVFLDLIDPFAQLEDILEWLAIHPVERLDQLLPDTWFMSHPWLAAGHPLEAVSLPARLVASQRSRPCAAERAIATWL